MWDVALQDLTLDLVIVDFTPRVPGTDTMVDHSIFQAFDKGALGVLEVSGPAAPDIFNPGLTR